MVSWTDAARADLRRFHALVAGDFPYYAKVVAAEIVAATRQLPRFPHTGRGIPETGDPAIRERTVHACRIVYRCRKRSIEVLAVLPICRQPSTAWDPASPEVDASSR